MKSIAETRFNTIATHFNSVLENLVPVDGNKILETKPAEKKKSALLENINVGLLKELTRFLLQIQRQRVKMSASNSPSMNLVYPAYVATLKSCEMKEADSAAFAAFKLQWSESMKLKWKPKIGPIHMLGFFLDPGMKHLPQCDDSEKDTIIEDSKMMCEMIKYEEGLVSPEPRLATMSSASEDSPVFFSRRRAQVIDLNSSNYMEDIIDDMR